MATNISSEHRCSKCNNILFAYIELKCKHKLCSHCTRKNKYPDDTIVCFSQKCKKVSQKIPAFSSVMNDMKTKAIFEYKVSLKKKEEACLEHAKTLERSVKDLWDEEERSMDLLSSMCDKRINEVKGHYKGLKRKAASKFRKREGQIHKMLTDIKNILTKIHDILKKMNDSEPQTEADIFVTRLQAHECASQTIDLTIPTITVAVQADGEMALSDTIQVDAPDPQLVISTDQVSLLV